MPSRDLFQPIAWFVYYGVQVLAYYVETSYKGPYILCNRYRCKTMHSKLSVERSDWPLLFNGLEIVIQWPITTSIKRR